MYKIVRQFFDSQRAPNQRVVKTGLALAEAQAHCRNPETSSQTCAKRSGRERTRMYGPWFDSYAECSR